MIREVFFTIHERKLNNKHNTNVKCNYLTPYFVVNITFIHVCLHLM